jgi:AcrR family transcriptional regulator
MKRDGRQRRPYRMVARAEAVEATGKRIVEAAASLFGTMLYEQVSLEAVAERAATTVQTIIRRFGSKDGLFAEVAQRRRSEIHGLRRGVQPGDIGAALTVLLDEYERWGTEILLLLAQEGRSALLSEIVESGRRFHHEWVKQVFSPLFEQATPAARRLGLQQIGAATDIYIWKIFRRDLGLDPRQTKAAMTGMIEGIVGQSHIAGAAPIPRARNTF